MYLQMVWHVTQDAALMDAETPRLEPETPNEEDLIDRYVASKSGWRRKPVTAKKHAQQLRSVFGKAAEATGEPRPDVLLRRHADQIEQVLQSELAGHTALVKSKVIALLEFARHVSARQPQHCAEWVSVISSLEIWKRDSPAMDLNCAAEVQDRMGEAGYLPSREELRELRRATLQELAKVSETVTKNRGSAVKMRRLLTVSILCDNFQRSGAISNATMSEYDAMSDGVIRVSEHKSRASYGSLNLVVKEQLEYLITYVNDFRPLLLKDPNDATLFPSARVSEVEICTGRLQPRLAASPRLWGGAAANISKSTATAVATAVSW